MSLTFIGSFGSVERGFRLLGSFGLVAAVLLLILPSWVALAAVYPFATALLAWDPLYAVLKSILNRLTGNKGASFVLAEES